MSTVFGAHETIELISQVENLKSLDACGQAIAVVALNGPNPNAGREELSFDKMISKDSKMRNYWAGAIAIQGGFRLHFVGGEADLNWSWTFSQFGDDFMRLEPTYDTGSRRTIGNAISTRYFAEQSGAAVVAPVTSNYHARRTRHDFTRVLGSGFQVKVCSPPVSPYSSLRSAYLRAAQLPIQVLDNRELRGYDPTSSESLEDLEARMRAGHRYTGEAKGILGRTSRLLDKLTTGN